MPYVGGFKGRGGQRIGVRFNEKDLKRIALKLELTRKRLTRNFANLPGELAVLGQITAKRYAPYYNGYLFRAIKVDTKDTSRAEIYVDNKILDEGLSPRNKGFNYAKYMHKTGGRMGLGRKIYSGDPRFMWTTREILREKLRERIKTRTYR